MSERRDAGPGQAPRADERPVGRSANRSSAAAARGFGQPLRNGRPRPCPRLNFAQHLNLADAVHGQDASWSPAEPVLAA